MLRWPAFFYGEYRKYKHLEAFKNTVVSVVSSRSIVKLFIFLMRKDHIICLSEGELGICCIVYMMMKYKFYSYLISG